MNYIYKNASKKIQHINFESGGKFLFKGQTLNSDEKALDVPDGVIEQVNKSRGKRNAKTTSEAESE